MLVAAATLEGVVPGPTESQQFYRGVAAVPPRRAGVGDTADIPRVGGSTAPARPAVAPGRGMIVRRRWRRLRSGAAWSWTGVSILVVCWFVWVVSVRGSTLAGPVIGLVLVLAIGALLFMLARLLGRVILEHGLHRERPSAWPSHLTVFGFWTLTGITFLQQTPWIQDTWQWFGDSGQLLSDTWDRLANLWPL